MGCGNSKGNKSKGKHRSKLIDSIFDALNTTILLKAPSDQVRAVLVSLRCRFALRT